MSNCGGAARVSTLAVAGQGIGFLLAVVLARQLGVDGFEAYVVASAVFMLMVTLAPRGVDKFALRLFPVLLEREDWGRAKGYLIFGARRTLWTSVAVGAAVGVWAWFIRDFTPDARIAVAVSCIGIPAGALVHFAMEVLTASGRATTAAAIFRVALPAVACASVGVMLMSPIQLTAAMAVACWGVGWTVALVMMFYQIRRTAPSKMWRADKIDDASAWASDALPFWIYQVCLAMLAQAGVIALDWLQPTATAVGAYAVAVGTARLAQVLATSTNRVYAGELSVLLERRDFHAVQTMRRKRLKWLALPLVVYLVATLVFPRELLSLFRPEFVAEGVNALRILAVATACNVLLAMAPTYLKFRKRNRTTYAIVASAAAAQLMLLWLLVPAMGATGAAWSYALAMCGMYVTFAWLAHRELALLQQ